MRRVIVLTGLALVVMGVIVMAHRKPKRIWKVDCITIMADKNGVIVTGVDGYNFHDAQMMDDFRMNFESACSHWIKESIGTK